MDKNKSNNIFYFTTAVIVFALIGTGLFLVNKRSIPDPVLTGKYKFSGNVSINNLNFDNSEINKLNRCVLSNRNVVENVSLIINMDEDGRKKSANVIRKDTKLRYKVVLESKSGMKFVPEVRKCLRKKLVGDIIYSFTSGAEALETYSADPDLKDKVIQIIGM